jgi:hypothetical protein
MKRAWIALGIKSELGRGEGLTLNGDVGEDIDHYRHKEGTRPLAKTYNTGGPAELAAEFNGRTPNQGLYVTGKDLRKGITNRFDDDEEEEEVRKPRTKFHSQPGGGPSHKSVWLGANGKPVGGSESINATNKPGETSSLKDGLTYGTTIHPYDEYVPDPEASQTGTSIFDPVVCELCYRWFCPARGTILDPFAGGSVRGIVASVLGRFYIGIDLRPEQVKANKQQANLICHEEDMPVWLCGDSQGLDDILDNTNNSVDFVFSCPPYYDLELYSDNPNDLSNMEWGEFCIAYKKIIALAVDKLRDNRFACFVVGDLRDKDGVYRNLPSLTIKCFLEAGCDLYNEAVLVTAVGSLPLRVMRQFDVSRKLGRTHQSALFFVKGDPALAAKACEPVEFVGLDSARLKSPEEAGEAVLVAEAV